MEKTIIREWVLKLGKQIILSINIPTKGGWQAPVKNLIHMTVCICVISDKDKQIEK